MPEAEKATIDEGKARAMILAETNLIKRPVLDNGDRLVFGFRQKDYEAATAALTRGWPSVSSPLGAPLDEQYLVKA